MPVSGRKIEDIDIKSILKRVSEYDIYRYYIGHDFTLGRAFNSPFRKERNPSFCINIDKRGLLHHIDFADSHRSGSCTDFVMQLFSIDYYQALKRIDTDLNIGLWNRSTGSAIRFSDPEAEKREETHIIVETRRFNAEELAYWNTYHIDRYELRYNNVFAIKQVYLNRQRFSLPDSQLAFAYYYPEIEKWKIYRPFAPNKKTKWKPNNVPNTTISGLSRIVEGSEKIVVTKSKKDEMVLSKFLPHVCSTQNESIHALTKTNIEFLQSRSSKIYINFDSDEVGVEACRYYNQFGFGWVNTPRRYTTADGHIIKDFADLAYYHGMDAVIQHFILKEII